MNVIQSKARAVGNVGFPLIRLTLDTTYQYQ